jgi:hypothetical protein
LTFVVARSDESPVVADFCRNIGDYTKAKEINQLPDEDWEQSIQRCKGQLIEALRYTRWLTCRLDTFDEFWAEFRRSEDLAAAKELIRILFRAWRYFFLPEQWSVVQALVLMAESGRQELTPKTVTKFIQTRSKTDPRFFWAKDLPTETLEPRVRKYLTRSKEGSTLGHFAFQLQSDPEFRPVVLTRERPKGPIMAIEVRWRELYDKLSASLQVDGSPADLDEIKAVLLSPCAATE